MIYNADIEKKIFDMDYHNQDHNLYEELKYLNCFKKY